MNRFYLRTLSYTLATIGFVLGFTSKVLAQYGAWVASYRYKGNVNSEICNESLNGIKVTLENDQHIVLAETFTNEKGYFDINTHSQFYDDSEKNLFLKFTDVDGSKNNGEFLPYTKSVESFKRNENYEITLIYDGKAPCLKELDTEKDLVENQLQQPKIDAVAIEPPKLTPLAPKDTIANELTLPDVDSVVIQLPKQTPLIPEPILDVFVYPNPNSGDFTVSYNLPEKGKVTISVYSGSGQLIFTESFFSESGELSRQFNMPQVATGNYVLTFRTGKSVISKNIVIRP